MTTVTYRPRYQIIEGIRFPAMFSSDCIRQSRSYVAQPNDVFIVTYPKCGTTWMQNIALYIFRKGKELKKPSDLFRMSPYMEAFGNQGIEQMPRPGALKAHYPYNRMPYNPHAKYIYVLRNPKDCCVSNYYFTKMSTGFAYWEAQFDDFFELFMAREVMYNDYFDHLASWYPHLQDKQVFFTTYEEMKENTEKVVHKLASFLGNEYTEAIQNDNSVLKNIIRFSSFEYMKKNVSGLYDYTLVNDEQLQDPHLFEGFKHIIRYVRSLNFPMKGQLEFIRKGMVGDWKCHLSEKQSERLSKKFLERTKGTTIQEMYKNYI